MFNNKDITPYLNLHQVIIVEDDLEFAPDFFEYFEATLPVLRSDPSLWCVSAWNDNGKRGIIDETKPELLYRTDFFGGLGWMMTKELWTQVLIVGYQESFSSIHWGHWYRIQDLLMTTRLEQLLSAQFDPQKILKTF